MDKDLLYRAWDQLEVARMFQRKFEDLVYACTEEGKPLDVEKAKEHLECAHAHRMEGVEILARPS